MGAPSIKTLLGGTIINIRPTIITDGPGHRPVHKIKVEYKKHKYTIKTRHQSAKHVYLRDAPHGRARGYVFFGQKTTAAVIRVLGLMGLRTRKRKIQNWIYVVVRQISTTTPPYRLHGWVAQEELKEGLAKAYPNRNVGKLIYERNVEPKVDKATRYNGLRWARLRNKSRGPNLLKKNSYPREAKLIKQGIDFANANSNTQGFNDLPKKVGAVVGWYANRIYWWAVPRQDTGPVHMWYVAPTTEDAEEIVQPVKIKLRRENWKPGQSRYIYRRPPSEAEREARLDLARYPIQGPQGPQETKLPKRVQLASRMLQASDWKALKVKQYDWEKLKEKLKSIPDGGLSFFKDRMYLRKDSSDNHVYALGFTDEHGSGWIRLDQLELASSLAPSPSPG